MKSLELLSTLIVFTIAALAVPESGAQTYKGGSAAPLSREEIAQRFEIASGGRGLNGPNGPRALDDASQILRARPATISPDATRRGLAEGFRHYVFVAQRLPVWAWVYPFVELGLGVLYRLGVDTVGLHLATLLVTVLNVVSVALKLAKKEVFMCACLGTVLKVPLTTVTLIEYGVMGLMAAAMLLR